MFQPSAVNKPQFKRVSFYFDKNTQGVLSRFSTCECTSNFLCVNPNCNGYMYYTVGDDGTLRFCRQRPSLLHVVKVMGVKYSNLDAFLILPVSNKCSVVKKNVKFISCFKFLYF